MGRPWRRVPRMGVGVTVRSRNRRFLDELDDFVVGPAEAHEPQLGQAGPHRHRLHVGNECDAVRPAQCHDRVVERWEQQRGAPHAERVHGRGASHRAEWIVEPDEHEVHLATSPARSSTPRPSIPGRRRADPRSWSWSWGNAAFAETERGVERDRPFEVVARDRDERQPRRGSPSTKRERGAVGIAHEHDAHRAARRDLVGGVARSRQPHHRVRMRS